MSKIIYSILNIFLLLIIYIFDRSNEGVFKIFDYFSFTILFININLLFFDIYIGLYLGFIFGLLVDWTNKVFLGVGSFFVTIIIFFYDLLKNKFIGNIYSQILLKFAFNVILFLMYFNFARNALVRSIIGAFIITLIITIVRIGADKDTRKKSV